MGTPSNREVVDRFFKLLNARRFDELATIVTPDMIYDTPQSGERIRGLDNARAAMENYPGLPTGDVKRVVGASDQWVLTPSLTPLRITGTGDHYTVEALETCPNGEVWNSVQIVEFREGKVCRVTAYFAQPYPAPEWRSKWVEKIPDQPGPEAARR